ncbi:cell division topological specificity factor MinE [candidate division KSB3 bacterium]|uniref:Cell division topological specificity factor n=1 Tax=candidate division KSB3 bacterium TaxID=2044937 RepID=A0A2G6E3U1_9BACT|nr:MAG: cell division topological specificity factor MinE [candidate division KSB3 bacterium]PIE29164.1 MAG: cell division topological specificity factor MinE [candidate division KSB3 bacterium]
MSEFLKRLFRRQSKSADVAAERLKIILAHERRGVSAPLMEQMKEEIIQVISKFVDIDSKHIEVRMSDAADVEMLEVTVPFQR